MNKNRKNVSKNISVKKASSSGAGASIQSQSFSLKAYFANHRQVGAETLKRLIQAWFTSLMTWLVIGVAFALPLILYILLNNVAQLGGDWEGKPRISIYLEADMGEVASQELLSNISANVSVADAKLITAELAIEEFQSSSGLRDVLASLPFNPLPAVIEIEPLSNSPMELKLLVSRLEESPGVESVSFDLAWVERLFAILALSERLVTALSVFLGLGVLLSIGNTIRLAIENRRAEIEVVKLVGGTDSYVRRPFLYLGLWYGLGGAILACFMVQIAIIFLSNPIEQLMLSYQNDFYLQGPGILAISLILLSGSLLGILGAALAVGRHLHLIEPN